MIVATTRGLEDERGPPADSSGDHAPDQRSGRRADAAQPADHAEGPGARREIGEPQRREDVDGRDQQRRTDALEHRVAEDQHAEARGDRAQQGADPVQDEARHEAPLAAPAVCQLATGDHQDRHDQQEQSDRGLDALHRRVEVVADVGDHHVHVRAGEAADELGERERKDQPPRRDGRTARKRALARRDWVYRHRGPDLQQVSVNACPLLALTAERDPVGSLLRPSTRGASSHEGECLDLSRYDAEAVQTFGKPIFAAARPAAPFCLTKSSQSGPISLTSGRRPSRSAPLSDGT